MKLKFCMFFLFLAFLGSDALQAQCSSFYSYDRGYDKGFKAGASLDKGDDYALFRTRTTMRERGCSDYVAGLNEGFAEGKRSQGAGDDRTGGNTRDESKKRCTKVVFMGRTWWTCPG